VTDDLLDLAVSLKVVESLAGKAAVDLETIDKSGDSDQTVGLDILLKLVVGGLVEDDGVLGLVLDCRAKDMLVNVALGVLLRIPSSSNDFFRVLWELGGNRHGRMVGDCVPLPLDHFFFCFLPPVAAGACSSHFD
jgi:hypothetical protein